MVRGVAKDAKKGIPEAIESGAKLAQKTTKAKNATIKANKIAKNAEALGVEARDLAGLTKEIDRLVPDQVDDIYEAAAKNKPLGIGSTGRTEPRDLREQAAMLVTRADPDKGDVLEFDLGDPRWSQDKGWQKMQTTFKNPDQRTITIHYVRNKHSGDVDDFKFVDARPK